MIGFYVHHHGWGHRTRAVRIARLLDDDVVGLGSLPEPAGWPGRWVALPPDGAAAPAEPTAGGVLHWAPLDHRGHRERLGGLAAFLAAGPAAMVVDTSAEVALLARLMGVRTAVVTPRGHRGDRPHEAAYDAASLLVAPWLPAAAEETWPQRWTDKAVLAGPISRFDGRTDRPAPPAGGTGVLVLWGAGGSDVGDDDLAAAAAATPGRRWTVRTPERPSPDVWAEVAAADVVVTHAGANAVAEVAAARRPAVVIAQSRPFDEQLSTVRALRRLGCCVALETWPAPGEWPGVLDRAARLGGAGWGAWSDGRGAERAAAAISDLAGRAR